MNAKLPTEDVLIVALVVRWTVQAVEMAAVLSGERQWCVIEADCLHVLPWLPDKSVSHVIEDPPYSDEVHAKQWVSHALTNHGEHRPRSKHRGIDFAALAPNLRRGVSEQAARIDRRWTLAFCDLEGIAGWRDDTEAAGLDYVRALVWDKVDSAPQFTGDRPASAAEAVVVAHQPGRKRWNGGGKRNVYRVPVNEERGDKPHPTTKPTRLMLELIQDFTDPGEVILDPFAGSGTTGVAALRLGRRAILIERDPKYAAIARQRMEAEERGQSLKEYRAGQRTLWEA